MSLQSMTGFGRSTGEAGHWHWVWEARSVNGRGLDLRLRLPPGFEDLDQPVRKAAQKRYRRGSITITLTAMRADGETQVRVNEAVLRHVLDASKHVQAISSGAPATVDGLLGLKGVLEIVEPSESEEDKQAARDAMLASLEPALSDLSQARLGEGAHLAIVMSEKISEIADLVAVISDAPSRQPQAFKDRLKSHVNRLLETDANLDEVRLHQEAVLLATRADVEEEVQRLTAHVAAARALLSETGAIGRKLDFLAQEFNREANTVCSKAPCNDISQAGLALKSAIDQMREQVQNIE